MRQVVALSRCQAYCRFQAHHGRRPGSFRVTIQMEFPGTTASSAHLMERRLPGLKLPPSGPPAHFAQMRALYEWRVTGPEAEASEPCPSFLEGRK
jgi:hypothetical protein